MEIITDRHEIAKALNFGKYPVLDINIDNEEQFERVNGIERYCKGCDVCVEYDTKNHGKLTTHGQVYYDFEESEPGLAVLNNIKISAEGECLKADYGYDDVMDDLRWAKAPVIHAGQEVIVVLRSEKQKLYTVLKYTVYERVFPYCSTCTWLE